MKKLVTKKEILEAIRRIKMDALYEKNISVRSFVVCPVQNVIVEQEGNLFGNKFVHFDSRDVCVCGSRVWNNSLFHYKIVRLDVLVFLKEVRFELLATLYHFRGGDFDLECFWYLGLLWP